MIEKILNKNEKLKGNILVVDDEEAFLYFVQEVLTENCYQCSGAKSGREAKLLLEKQMFDLVISDIRMPEESGLDLCNYVKSMYPDIAVMVVTAVDSLEIAQEAINYDVYGYLIKPVTINQLKISVANAMRRKALEAKEKGIREQLEKMVSEKTAHLEELNTTLRILLDQREEEKKKMEEELSYNINTLVIPYMDRLRKTDLNALQGEYIDTLEFNLRETIRPYRHRMAEKMLRLTPSEVLVLNHVKIGRSSKEIASELNLSVRTVEFHRDNIRKKLDISNRNINLQTYLSDAFD